jgi:hypothetical protein
MIPTLIGQKCGIAEDGQIVRGVATSGQALARRIHDVKCAKH